MTKLPETNYAKNQQNPRPSKESIEEQNDEKAGKNINWVIFIAIVLLIIAFFLIFKNTEHSPL